MKLLSRTSLATGMALALALGAPTAAYAQATYSFNMPAQDLGRALRTVARRTGTNIVFEPASVRGRQAPALNGSFSAQQAIERLLAGSGLGARRTSGGSWVVSGSGEAQAGSAAADDGSADVAQAGVAEILVVGSRSQNVDVRRTEDDPQPYVVFGRDEIQRSQATNLEEFFRTRLPMNTQQGSSATGGGATGADLIALDNTSQINLRGLGSNQTLILVDGRRVPRLALSGVEFTQGDLNGIPLSSIERIEVLPSTAGGIYGGGAVGGVINIIRRRDYRGIELRASYQGTFRGGGESYQFDASGGFSPDRGRTQVTFSGSYSDSRPLYAGDNDLWRRSRELARRNQPAGNVAYSGSTPNVYNSTTNLVLDDGTPLGSRFAYIPAGYAGPLGTGDGGRALLATAGQFNIDLSNDAFGRYAPMRSNPRTWSGNFNIRREITRQLDIFTNFDYGESLSRSSFSGIQAGQFTIAANSPNNPFRQDITVYFPLIGAEQTATIETRSLSSTTGLIYRPARNWSATFEYGFNRVISQSDFVAQPLQTAISTAIRTGALDVFRDVNQFRIDLSPYLPPRTDRAPFETRQQIISARVAGTLLDLPAGPLSLTTLLEHRDERLAASQSSTATATMFRFPRSQTNDAAYAELSVPLVSDRNAMTLVRALDLQFSVRHDRYRTRSPNPSTATVTIPVAQIPGYENVENTFNSTDFTVAARWSPIRGISLRASYGTGFLPPSISQLVGADNPNIVNGQFIVDPKRGNVVDPTLRYNIRSGGNIELLPEESRNLSLGVILSPAFAPGFRLSVDYTSIRKSGEIVSPQDQDIVTNEDLFPGRITRGPNRPGDPAGWAGPITFIDRTLVNFARTEARSLDFQANYEFSPGNFGTFQFYALATRQLRLRRQFLTTTTVYELVDRYEGPLEWRGNGGIDWRLDGWRAGWSMQVYSSHSIRYASPAPALVLQGNLLVALQGSERIPSQAYHDVYLGYDFPREGHPLSGTRVSLGIQNVFDHRPPAIASTPINGYSRYGDPRLRRFTLSLSKSF